MLENCLAVLHCLAQGVILQKDIELVSVADVLFHGYANYEKGLGEQFLKLTSCNTTSIIRALDCLNREVGDGNTMMTLVCCVVAPGDYHLGLINSLNVETVPSHRATDRTSAISPGGLKYGYWAALQL